MVVNLTLFRNILDVFVLIFRHVAEISEYDET